MYMKVFLLCLFAHFNCHCSQPGLGSDGKESLSLDQKANMTENHSLNHKPNIKSLITDAGNCKAYEVLKSKLPTFSNYTLSHCDRSVIALPGPNDYIDYGLCLCMVLYEVVRRVCKMKEQDVKLISEVIQIDSNHSGVCDEMNKILSEVEGTWVSFLKVKFENGSNCEQTCLQGNVTNPLCVYILKGNILAMTSKKDMSSGGNPNSEQLGSQDPGKVNETSIDKVKVLLEEASEATSAADPQVLKPKNENKERNPSSNKTLATDKNNVHNYSETNAGTTKPNSTVDMQANLTKQIHAENNNQSDAVTVLNTTSSHNKSMKAVLAEKQKDILENVTYPKTEMTAAPVSENKASAVVEMPNKEVQNKNVDNSEHALPTEKKYNKSQNTDSAYNVPNDDDHEQSEDNVNVDIPGEQSEQDEQTEQAEEAEQGDQIQKENEKHQEATAAAAGNDDTARFNQMGDSEDSHFYAYFMTMVVVCIIGYLVFHNKQKILALALEGRSRRGTRRRPSTSAYRKLDSNLEEAVTSTCSTSVTHVIY